MVRITLRLPADLHEQIKQIAKRSERSLNGQILYILKRWIESYNDIPK